MLVNQVKLVLIEYELLNSKVLKLVMFFYIHILQHIICYSNIISVYGLFFEILFV